MEKIKYHILVVDDDDRIRDLVKEYLSENGFIVSTGNNAEEAKTRLEYFKFDLMVLDVMMPGQNGYDLTKDIKKQMKVPVIWLTAKGEGENRIKGLELGADDYLAKPFDTNDLAKGISWTLDNFKSQRYKNYIHNYKLYYKVFQFVKVFHVFLI